MIALFCLRERESHQVDSEEPCTLGSVDKMLDCKEDLSVSLRIPFKNKTKHKSRYVMRTCYTSTEISKFLGACWPPSQTHLLVEFQASKRICIKGSSEGEWR